MPERPLEDAVRSMLDEEAPAQVPASLRASADAIPQSASPASRRQSRYRLRSLAGLAAAVVLTAILGLGLSFRGGTGDTSTLPPPSPSAAPAATSAAPSPVSSPGSSIVGALPPGALGAPGSIVIANVEPGAHNDPTLRLEVISADARTPVTGTYPFWAPDGWQPARTPRVALSADGWAAIALDPIDATSTDEAAVMVLDLLGDSGALGPIPGSGASWLSDGTLLLTEQVRTKGASHEVARRIADHGLGQATDLMINDQVPSWSNGYPVLPAFPGYYVVEADDAGLRGYVFQGTSKPEQPVTLRWDGSLSRRDVVVPPFLTFGTERAAGARGEAVVGCADGSCPRQWRRPDGTLVPFPYDTRAATWTRPGDALVALSDTQVGSIADSAEGLTWTPIGDLPPASLEGDTVWFSGMSDWAAVLETDAGQVSVVPLDHAGVIGPLNGTLAAVRPPAG